MGCAVRTGIRTAVNRLLRANDRGSMRATVRRNAAAGTCEVDRGVIGQLQTPHRRESSHAGPCALAPDQAYRREILGVTVRLSGEREQGARTAWFVGGGMPFASDMAENLPARVRSTWTQMPLSAQHFEEKCGAGSSSLTARMRGGSFLVPGSRWSHLPISYDL
eukprot:520629-Prymnesium_polylepis.1